MNSDENSQDATPLFGKGMKLNMKNNNSNSNSGSNNTNSYGSGGIRSDGSGVSGFS